MEETGYVVFMTEDAERDVEKIYDYIAQQDCPGKAEYVLAQIEKKISSLSDLPERGVYPQELVALGIRKYREIFFKPYRIIYQVTDGKIYVMLVADGRRNMQYLLQVRLFEG